MRDNYWRSFDKLHEENKEIPILPLVHTTCYQVIPDIKEKKGFLAQKEDEFYKEKRTFFYYGKPAYLDYDHNFPTILVFDFNDDELFNDFDWVFMDSGTLKILNGSEAIVNYFKNYSPESLKNNFVLNSDIVSGDVKGYIKSHIKYFFENNSNYYDGALVISEDEKIKITTPYKSVKDYYEVRRVMGANDVQKKIYSNSIKIDKRDKVIEASSILSLRLSNLKCIGCYGPDHEKENIMSDFKLENNQIKTYNSRALGQGLDKDKIIQDGDEWVKSIINDRL